jgi:branched-chain amino acid transport system ATP-binding protein
MSPDSQRPAPSVPKLPGPALTVEGLSAGYSRTPIVQDVDLEGHLGSVVLLVGPNGAGKSTLLKAVVGVIPRLTGRVTVLGNDVSGWNASDLTRVGVAYVPQQDDVFLPLSVHDNLLLGGYLLPRKLRLERVEERLAEFPALQAARSRPAGTLSGGQRKTLALARALMLDPEVVILDEPTAGLAPKIARQVLEENIGPLSEMGKAVLMVEQRVADALRVADRIYLLVSGRVVLSESAAEFGSRSDLGRWLMGAMPEEDIELPRV